MKLLDFFESHKKFCESVGGGPPRCSEEVYSRNWGNFRTLHPWHCKVRMLYSEELEFASANHLIEHSQVGYMLSGHCIGLTDEGRTLHKQLKGDYT